LLDITVLILTYNEELHIKRCIEKVKSIATYIYVIDSFSSDSTVDIATKFGVTVFKNKWENNYAKQFNWALDNCPITTKWVLRLDADEYLTDELIIEIKEKLLTLEDDVTGIAFPLKRIFLNKEIKKGILKLNLLRLFQYGKGRCEQKWMDEHIKLYCGRSVVFKNPFADHNLNGIHWWTQKHNNYSIREAIDLLNIEYQLLPEDIQKGIMEEHTAAARQKKIKYVKMPLFWRSFLLFIYRYIFNLGFTAGKEGFLWHFLQGWWYRTLADAKVYEIKKACGSNKEKMIDYIKVNYNIDCTKV
jgi:glycosyltransferase involved in cell wall biosynthesis